MRHPADQVEEVAEMLAAVGRRLACSPSPVDLMVAARDLQIAELRLGSLERGLQRALPVSTDPAVLTVLHRVRVLRAVTDRAAEVNTDRLPAWDLLFGQDERNVDGPDRPHSIRTISGGAPGLGKRA